MRTNDPIRVLVSHEDPIVAAGLAATLARHGEFQVVVSEEESLARATGLVDDAPGAPPSQGADIVLADYHRGCTLMTDPRRARAATARQPRVMLVTRMNREWDVRSAMEMGIHGYVLTRCDLQEVIDAVRAVARGSRYLCRMVAHCVAESLTRERLTSRETDVLDLLAQGHCNKSIASQLEISVGTVKAHVKAILEKLDAASRTQAAAVAAQRGLVARWQGTPLEA